MNREIKDTVNIESFSKLDVRVGTITKVLENTQAKTPAYVLTIDFGELGIKTSSAQITANYSEASLIGKQVVAIVNLPPKRVAGIQSEV